MGTPYMLPVCIPGADVGDVTMVWRRNGCIARTDVITILSTR